MEALESILRVSTGVKSEKIADNEIVERVLKGEKIFFEILLRRYNQTLYRVIRSFLKHDEDVEDAMQDTYLKAYKKLPQFRGSAAFSTWLIRIGINEAILLIRSHTKEQKLYTSEDASSTDKIVQLPDARQMNPEKQAILCETRHMIEQVIDQLPEKYRVIYMLREIEGMKNNEIANCRGISNSNVKVRLHRAKVLMKEALYKLSLSTDIFEFGNSKCDRLVDYVMQRI